MTEKRGRGRGRPRSYKIHGFKNEIPNCWYCGQGTPKCIADDDNGRWICPACLKEQQEKLAKMSAANIEYMKLLRKHKRL